jgi:hypothetical protein
LILSHVKHRIMRVKLPSHFEFQSRYIYIYIAIVKQSIFNRPKYLDIFSFAVFIKNELRSLMKFICLIENNRLPVRMCCTFLLSFCSDFIGFYYHWHCFFPLGQDIPWGILMSECMTSKHHQIRWFQIFFFCEESIRLIGGHKITQDTRASAFPFCNGDL